MTEMTQLNQRPADDEGAALNPQAIAAFLTANPDFFIQQPELLEQLRLPHAERGSVSLVERQMERLRHKVAELEKQIESMMSVAASNSTLFAAFARAQQQLFQTHNIYQALSVLTALATELDLRVSVRLFDSMDAELSLSRQAFEGFRRARLNPQDVYLGRLRSAESEMLFAQPPQLGSFIVLKLGESERPDGVLCFASRDGGHFQPGMDTLFVTQLADVLGRLIRHWEYSREVIE
ncbi:DUF484 family protein [Photobacterium halotolerans]|uniref:DUF484 family protein n=1 Tax=Photobacterium halotolerans TaxID=265726 RepID=A0A7X5BL54_9GAMM|nr:DUF484 family protein [Photobacterium halotolerans]NAW66406.1 DUF484 family protein [Photobacterium halotolerans]NAW88699.1 DUF484 family protein [Photobacterium halotolerans]NAX47284.1 DUF484 family protein [Photobacterium halotolerans]